MSKKSYIITTTVCCFIVLLFAVGKYVFENDRLIRMHEQQNEQISTLHLQLETLQANLEESHAIRQTLERESKDSQTQISELQAMLNVVNEESSALEKKIARFQEDLIVMTREKKDVDAKYRQLNEQLSKKNFIAELIRETAELRSSKEKFEEILEQKNQEIGALKTAFDSAKSDSEDIAVKSSVIANLSQELAKEKERAHHGEQIIKRLEDQRRVLHDRVLAHEDKVKKLQAAVETTALRLQDKEQDNVLLAQKLEKMKDLFNQQVDRINSTRVALDQELGKAREILSEEEHSVVTLPPVHVASIQSDRRDNAVPAVRNAVAGPDTIAAIIQGRVLSANSEIQSFVIVDKGKIDGLREGTVLDVLDAEERNKIAELEVVQIRENVSAAKIKRLSRGETIKEGHIVKTQ